MATPLSRSASVESAYIPLSAQVGGHPGVLTSEDGALLIKPAIPTEVQFYQAVLSEPVLEPLRPYVPQFLGTLRLEGEVDEARSKDGAIAVTPESAKAVKDEQKDECRIAECGVCASG
jgi:inositol-polyphosphate multikinase